MTTIRELPDGNHDVTRNTDRPVLVTGATGNVGREVVNALHDLGAPARATARNAQNADHVPDTADETVRFDFGKRETYAAAFDGVRKLFLMRPPAISDVETYMKPVITYAAAVGVEQIAFLSLIGVEEKSYVPHYKVEKLVKASGVSYTFLRAGFFMQNLNTTHRADIVEHDEIFIPAGDARTAFVDVRDIGAVAARVLTTPGHENAAYELTGKEALTYDEVAGIFTDVLGREIAYANPSLLRFAWRMKQRGHPWTYVAVTTGLYLSTRRGSAAAVTGGVRRLLGREPITMRQYVEDYASVWQE